MGRWPLERHVLTKSLKKTCLSNVRSTFGSNLPITGTKFYRRINYFDVKRMRRLLSLHRRGAFRAVSSTTTTGFPLVLQRCAGIMQNIAEITMNKVLYIHCDRGDGLIQHLGIIVNYYNKQLLIHWFIGKSTKFAISACTFDSRIIDECKNIKQYTDVELLHSDNTDTVLPYRNRSFQIVVSLHPLHYSVDNHVIDGRIVSVR